MWNCPQGWGTRPSRELRDTTKNFDTDPVPSYDMVYTKLSLSWVMHTIVRRSDRAEPEGQQRRLPMVSPHSPERMAALSPSGAVRCQCARSIACSRRSCAEMGRRPRHICEGPHREDCLPQFFFWRSDHDA